MKRELTESAKAAKAIKKELKQVFPAIKFSVKSENFSMGNSVSISYQNGPKRGAVEDIVNKYQYGSFNGMEDIYENTNSREDIPQAKWVSVGRDVSEDIYQEALCFAKGKINSIDKHATLDSYLPLLGMNVYTLLHRVLYSLDLSNGFNGSIARWTPQNG